MRYARNLFAMPLAVTALGLTLTLGAPAIAAEEHDHDHASMQLQLDHGRKWKIDAVVHRGMDEIRTAMVKSAPDIHKKTFTPEQYEALGAHIMTQINDMVINCKLPEETDAQFHIIITQITNGVEEMKTLPDPGQGVEKIIRALADYGKYFTHAGWRPL